MCLVDVQPLPVLFHPRRLGFGQPVLSKQLHASVVVSHTIAGFLSHVMRVPVTGRARRARERSHGVPQLRKQRASGDDWDKDLSDAEQHGVSDKGRQQWSSRQS